MAVVTTLSDVRVTESLKGDATGGVVIKVSQLGGEWEGVNHEDENTVLLSTLSADPVLLFLSRYEDHYDLINPTQGFLRVVDGKIQPAAAGVFAKIVTVDDVRNLVESDGRN